MYIIIILINYTNINKILISININNIDKNNILLIVILICYLISQHHLYYILINTKYFYTLIFLVKF